MTSPEKTAYGQPWLPAKALKNTSLASTGCLLVQHYTTHGLHALLCLAHSLASMCSCHLKQQLDWHSSKYPLESPVISTSSASSSHSFFFIFPLFPSLFLEATLNHTLKRNQNQHKATSGPCVAYSHRDTRGWTGAMCTRTLGYQTLIRSGQFCPQENSGHHACGRQTQKKRGAHPGGNRVPTQMYKRLIIFSQNPRRLNHPATASMQGPTSPQLFPKQTLGSGHLPHCIFFVRRQVSPLLLPPHPPSLRG